MAGRQRQADGSAVPAGNGQRDNNGNILARWRNLRSRLGDPAAK